MSGMRGMPRKGRVKLLIDVGLDIVEEERIKSFQTHVFMPTDFTADTLDAKLVKKYPNIFSWYVRHATAENVSGNLLTWNKAAA